MSRKVLASFESADRSHCVDVFVREDGSFGFEEFRRECDGGPQWQALGNTVTQAFGSGAAALAAAQARVPWLSAGETWRW
jgi:hypothetical protein